MATIPHDSVTVVVYVNSLTDTIIAADYINALMYQIRASRAERGIASAGN